MNTVGRGLQSGAASARAGPPPTGVPVTGPPVGAGPAGQAEAVERLLAAHTGPAWVYDPDTHEVLGATPAGLACYGYSTSDLPTIAFTDLFDTADLAALEQAMAARSTTFLSSGPWHHRDADGQRFDVMISSRVVDEAAGRRAVLAVIEPVPALPGVPLETHQVLAAGTGTLRAALAELLVTIARAGEDGAVVLVGLRDLADLFARLGATGGYDLARAVHQRLTVSAGNELAVLPIGEGRFCGIYHGPPDGALALAHRLEELLRRPIDVPGHGRLRLAPVVGLRTVGTDGGDPEQLLADAYLALGEALDTRQRVVCYEPSLRARREAHANGRLAVAEAVAERRFVPHFQPVVDLATGTTTSYEALLRWPSGALPPLRPDEVVALAEESDVDGELGAQVLEQAVARAGEWRRAGLPAAVAVNVSARQLSNQPLEPIVLGACGAAGFPAELLTLELTESSFLSLTEAAADNVTALRRLGVHFAIDDFGTGYSSLGYLRSLPVDVVKLDRCFISGAPHRAADRAIVEAVVTLAHALGLEVVAEGVEDAGELELLAGLAVDQVQGFYFSPAVPAERVGEVAAFDLPWRQVDAHRREPACPPTSSTKPR